MSILRTTPGLADQVYQAVLDEICDGLLPSGAHLVQEQMAERFGVSRQPIQQAMALLKADGLVEEVGKRGLQVAELDLALMRHHYEIRAALDALAARLAALRSRDDGDFAKTLTQQGQALLARGRKAVVEGVTLEQIRADETFHKLIYEASGNPLLGRTAEPHWRFLRRVMSDVLRRAQAPSTIWDQHEQILTAIVHGKAEEAEAKASNHINKAAEALLTVLQQGDDSSQNEAATTAGHMAGHRAGHSGRR